MRIRCTVCGHKVKQTQIQSFPFHGRTVYLCGSCAHKVRESIGGINDGIAEYVSEDMAIKGIAMDLYENYKPEFRDINVDEKQEENTL